MSKEARLAQAVANERIMAHNRQVALETTPERIYFSSVGGDHLTLRGLPVEAEGVDGAILGTRPDKVIIR